MNNNNDYLFNKFERFIKLALVNQKNLDESKRIVSIFREEKSLAQCVENSLRQQLTGAQERIINLQKDLNEMFSLKEKYTLQQQKIEKQAEIISSHAEIIKKLQTSIEQKVTETKLEIELKKEINNLQKQCHDKDNKFYLLSCEHQSLVKQKEKQSSELQENVKNLTNEVEETKLESNMMKNDLDRLNIIHSKRIRDYEQTIQQYEKDRRSILGLSDDQHQPKHKITINDPKKPVSDLWDKKVNITWADAARKATVQPNREIPTDIQDNAITSQTLLDIPAEAWEENLSAENVPSATITFKPKFKTPHQSTLVHALRRYPSASKAKPLDIITVKDNFKPQPKKKKIYSENDDDFLF